MIPFFRTPEVRTCRKIVTNSTTTAVDFGPSSVGLWFAIAPTWITGLIGMTIGEAKARDMEQKIEDIMATILLLLSAR